RIPLSAQHRTCRVPALRRTASRWPAPSDDPLFRSGDGGRPWSVSEPPRERFRVSLSLRLALQPSTWNDLRSDRRLDRTLDALPAVSLRRGSRLGTRDRGGGGFSRGRFPPPARSKTRGMIWQTLRTAWRLGLAAFFRRIEVAGLENVPSDGAVLLVPNHTNAFVDAFLLATVVPRRITLTAKSTLLR